MWTSRISARERDFDGPTRRAAEGQQQRLGHSDPQLALGTYTHVASEDDAKIAQQLGKILHPFEPTPKEKGLTQIEQALLN